MRIPSIKPQIIKLTPYQLCNMQAALDHIVFEMQRNLDRDTTEKFVSALKGMQLLAREELNLILNEKKKLLWNVILRPKKLPIQHIILEFVPSFKDEMSN